MGLDLARGRPDAVTEAWRQRGLRVAEDPQIVVQMAAPLLDRLGAHDRALMLRCAIPPSAGGASRAGWTAVTHAGGTGPAVLAAGLPALGCCDLRRASILAAVTLAVSHLLVQLIKRTIVRGRPSAGAVCTALVREPDRFSFPSGHAAAAMSIAVSYGLAFPRWGGPLLLLALAVGFSRIRLGVHYPSDVLAGQLIALGTGAALWAVLSP
jgi:undecaprenyl-diphosphatase